MRCTSIPHFLFFFFFLNDPPPTEISPLPLPAALPISRDGWLRGGAGPAPDARRGARCRAAGRAGAAAAPGAQCRSEEHTSELQSQSNLVCRLLLEKKKKKTTILD